MSAADHPEAQQGQSADPALAPLPDTHVARVVCSSQVVHPPAGGHRVMRTSVWELGDVRGSR